MKLGWFPQSPSKGITFLIFISQKIFKKIKDVEFDFRMGCNTCLISVFMNNKCAIYKFWINEFFVFQNEQYWLTLIQNNHFYH